MHARVDRSILFCVSRRNVQHVLHSLTPLFLFDFSDDSEFDLGTGVDFQACPWRSSGGSRNVLLDSIRKKKRLWFRSRDGSGDRCLSGRAGRGATTIRRREGHLIIADPASRRSELVHWVVLLRSLPLLTRETNGERRGSNRRGGCLKGRSRERDCRDEVKSLSGLFGSSDVVRGSIELGLEDKKAVIVSI